MVAEPNLGLFNISTYISVYRTFKPIFIRFGRGVKRNLERGVVEAARRSGSRQSDSYVLEERSEVTGDRRTERDRHPHPSKGRTRGRQSG